MKNMITAQDEAILEAKTEKWLNCDPALKEQVKVGVCFTPLSPPSLISV
jgi:hypothetical protein